MKIADYTDTWYYTNLWDNYDGMTSIEKLYDEWNGWLWDNAGEGTYTWRHDARKQVFGVYIEDHSVATMFKIKFGL